MPPGPAGEPDPLPSWREGSARREILDFVADVTDEDGDGFVPPSQRIAVFDNDGTLWLEQPVYPQLIFALDRVRTLAPEHPEWSSRPPFQAVLEDDLDTVLASGKQGLLELVMASHAEMTVDEFESVVREWQATSKHPRFKRPYPELVYAPMVELLGYLRANGFKTYIVSAGGVEFMRAFAEEVYGIPPEQVIGSSIRTTYELRDGEPTLVRLPELFFVDDREAKPVGIQTFIGRRPIAAFGNSDGDLQMIQWTTAGPGRRLGVLVHHTDEAREYAYDRASAVGRLDEALDEAERSGWLVVDMQRDWSRVFSFEE
jgi:phosphoglycolate phosphatase-like HAD superfamily hydrolase